MDFTVNNNNNLIVLLLPADVLFETLIDGVSPASTAATEDFDR